MRTVQTFILRLLVDPAEPGTLRGAVTPVPDGKSRPFASGEALLALLGQRAGPAPVTPGSETIGHREESVEEKEP